MFRFIRQLNKGGSVALVQDEKGNFFVRRIIPRASLELYKRLRTVDSPNIVKIIAINTIENAFEVIEEFIHGCTVEQCISNGEHFTEKAVNKYATEICSAIGALHRKGIVHRDITSTNVMITGDNRAVIIDFGISRIMQNKGSHDTTTLGTVGFAPPEQFGFTQTDSKSDIYSLGVLIGYMLTGQIEPQPEKCGSLKYVVAKCTAFDPNTRYSNIGSVVSALNAAKSKVWIVGYRSKKWYKMLIATIYYLYCFMGLYPIYTENAVSSHLKAIAVVLWFCWNLIVPVWLIFDAFHWRECRCFRKIKPVWLLLATATIWLILSIVLHQIVFSIQY